MTLPFALKKTTKAPNCIVMRCSALAADKLCEKHEREWQAAGRPELTYTAPAPKAAKPGTALALAPEVQAEIVEARHKLQDALARAQSFALDTPEQRETAQAIANGFHEKAKEFRATLKRLLAPFKEGIAGIENEIKPNIDCAEAIKATLLERLGQKNAELQLERDAALKVIAAGAGDAPASAFLSAHTDLSVPEGGGGFTDDYEYEVVDAKQLPRTFWMEVINHPALEAYVKANKDQDVPPGVRVTVRRVAKVGRAA